MQAEDICELKAKIVVMVQKALLLPVFGQSELTRRGTGSGSGARKEGICRGALVAHVPELQEG